MDRRGRSRRCFLRSQKPFVHLQNAGELLILIAIVELALIALGERPVHAHNGRGFEIEVGAGKLQAQGVHPVETDGAPAVRSYISSLVQPTTRSTDCRISGHGY